MTVLSSDLGFQAEMGSQFMGCDQQKFIIWI
jgi:hypothetical protein